MKTLLQIKSILQAFRNQLSLEFGVSEIGVFGSYSRNEQTENSDIDILVAFDRKIGLFKFIELEQFLSKLLGAKVDLVTRPALKPHIGENILKEVVFL